MTRTIRDGGLDDWEVFALPDRHGFPARGRVAFRALTNAGRRTRVTEIDGSKAEAERLVVDLSEAELRDLLERAQEVA